MHTRKPRSEKEKVWHGDGFAVKFSEKVHKRLTSAVLHGVSMLRRLCFHGRFRRRLGLLAAAAAAAVLQVVQSVAPVRSMPEHAATS